jgi:hypothetical protein
MGSRIQIRQAARTAARILVCIFDPHNLINNLVEKCTFPITWTAVGKLSFEVVASQILTTVGAVLGNVPGELTGDIGSIAYYMDDFDATYTCDAGKSNSALASNLCV